MSVPLATKLKGFRSPLLWTLEGQPGLWLHASAAVQPTGQAPEIAAGRIESAGRPSLVAQFVRARVLEDTLRAVLVEENVPRGTFQAAEEPPFFPVVKTRDQAGADKIRKFAASQQRPRPKPKRKSKATTDLVSEATFWDRSGFFCPPDELRPIHKPKRKASKRKR